MKSIANKIPSKNQAVKKTAEFASNNSKELLILLGIAVGGYMLYKTVKGISNAVQVENDPDAGSGNMGTTNADNTVQIGGTITKNQAKIAASRLLNAMNIVGTDVSTIYAVLEDKTAKDYALISNEFGEERYTGIAKGPWPNKFRNLAYWLQSELSNNQYETLKQKMPNVLV
ncbi:hypothetical protein [Cochleicola gelatinilyticus]|uniref:Uncharacterized protein n=1 Tax=Cochleicola gelatinilyticus TaxID=1763537 RepID=A0A167IKI7_9FLAO|nr:hypothetical protein [Cochleicola gelatinilyticus]OAB79747.1 hypothetical protein ULVI_03100 [Cochleicola gelatinilyticus]